MIFLTRTTTNIRVLAIAVALLCAIGFMPLLADSMQSHAAAKLKVSKTSATITGYGKTVKITAKGLKAKELKKVTWSSSDTKIATVTKKGKTATITAVYNGEATITAKYKGKKATVKVTVNVDNPSVTGNYQTEGTMYALLYQESAEVAALQMQAFNLAKIRIDEAMAKNGNTGKGLAIVTDIDSTIADDTCYIAGAVLDSAARVALGLEPWNNDDWDGYYQAVATEADTVLPGAKEFVDYTYKNGFEWYYITNRPYYELDLTVQQLYHQGFLEYAPDANGNKIPDLVEAYAVLSEDPDGAEGTFKTYQDYFYYGDAELGALDKDGWMSVYDNAAYTKVLNASGKVEMTPQSFSVKDDYRVQVQGTDFDSDKGWRRANVAKTVGGYDKIVMYLGDSINDMVSDYETKYPEIWGGTDRWNGNGADFTRKQFNDKRTANASKDYWKNHWGNDFIVLPNATYGDWYKATWAKGKDPDNKYDSGTREGQQAYIFDQIWAHSYQNTEKFNTWYTGPSPTDPTIQ